MTNQSDNKRIKEQSQYEIRLDNVNKEIDSLNKKFESFKNDLINHSETEKEYQKLNILAQETNALQTAIGKYDNMVISIRAFTLSVYISGIGYIFNNLEKYITKTKNEYNFDLLTFSLQPNIFFIDLSIFICILISSFICIAFFMEKKYIYFQKKFMLRMTMLTQQANSEFNHRYNDLDKFKTGLKSECTLTENTKCLLDKKKSFIFSKLDISLNNLFSSSKCCDDQKKK